MEQYIVWSQHHLLLLSLIPANLLMIEQVVKSSAEAHGYKNTASICDKVGNFISFLADVLSGLLAKKDQPVEVPKTGV